jgi:NAD(P)-dependent dehydrogenase (short-subunit alcohol dehydrogenase family)
MLATNPFSLVGKNILVTGASSGIGKSVAVQSSAMGANLIICGRNESRLQETFDILHIDKNQIHKKLIFDLKDEESIKEISKNINNLDGVVLAAGNDVIIPFNLTDRSTLYGILDDNLIGNVSLLQNLIKFKKIESNSSIVFFSSVNGTLIGSKCHSLYAAAKGAINGIVRSLANELSRKKIRVNAVAPGLVETGLFDLNKAIISAEEFSLYQKSYPLGFGKPEDISLLTIFLLSTASRWITGQIITIDGGLTINH